MNINDNRYIKPDITEQDRVNNDINRIKESLQNCTQIHPENYEDLEPGVWIKYITYDNKFRNGGVLIYNKAPKYLVLKNVYNKFTWSVNLERNIIFMRDKNDSSRKMIEKNNLYKLYQAGLVKILDEPEPEF
tara:strand:+ start:144 stop:539 length:396 start_codon:yes stop_codon:yes gene_type:complete